MLEHEGWAVDGVVLAGLDGLGGSGGDGRADAAHDLGDECRVTLVLFAEEVELLLFEETGSAELYGSLVEVGLVGDESGGSEEALFEAFADKLAVKERVGDEGSDKGTET